MEVFRWLGRDVSEEESHFTRKESYIKSRASSQLKCGVPYARVVTSPVALIEVVTLSETDLSVNRKTRTNLIFIS